MLRLTFIILTFILFSCNEQTINKDQAIFDRIEFIYNLKETIGEDVWKTFTNNEFDVPLIYYTDTSSYIANPTENFLSIFKSKLVYESRPLKIFKTEKLLDSIPFHMETGMTLGDTTNEYNYHSPFMKCSSFEMTKKTVPKVKSTEQWTTMIMHEYFHGFQYKHRDYLNYYEKNIVQIQPDSLRSVYKNNNWFKEKIDLENSLLLQAITEKDSLKTNFIIDTFFKVREERRKLTKQKLNFEIGNYEKCYETMEGTARYVEYSLYNKFSTRRGDYKLVKSDTSYKSFDQYRKYNIENDQWLFMTSKTTYFYAIGFNIARLLDKLKVEYKSKLFNQGGLSLEEILKAR
jgi:hypothetical protein